MTQGQKAQRYDALVAEGDKVQREINKIKNQYAFGGEMPADVKAAYNVWEQKMNYLTNELTNLVNS